MLGWQLFLRSRSFSSGHVLCVLKDLMLCCHCKSRGVRDAVGDTGAVEATAVALQRLAAALSQPPRPAAEGGPAVPSQRAPLAAQQGLEVLHCVCAGHGGNLGRLAGAGGLPAVAAG